MTYTHTHRLAYGMLGHSLLLHFQIQAYSFVRRYRLKLYIFIVKIKYMHMAENYSSVICTCTVIFICTVTFKQTSNKISVFLYSIVASFIKIAHRFFTYWGFKSHQLKKKNLSMQIEQTWRMYKNFTLYRRICLCVDVHILIM